MIQIKISYSRVSSYLSCPQKHYFSYVENLAPKGVVRPLSFGSDFHKLLQYRNNISELVRVKGEIEQAYSDLTYKQRYDLGENYLSDLDEIFSDYLEYWGDEEDPIQTEVEFLVPIGKYKGEDIYFHGIIDEVYADGSLGEHKTFNALPDMGILAMNMQVCLYSKAWELKTGKKLNKVRWDYIKSTPAQYPIWLETSKRFSTAANRNVTHLSYRRACDLRGIEDEEIRDKASLFRHSITNFFFRVNIDILPEMVETVWNSFKTVVKDIARRGKTNKTKNISRDCSWCNYRSICFAEFTGADTDYVKKTDYVIRQRVE